MATTNVSQNWKYVGSTVVNHLCCIITGFQSGKMQPKISHARLLGNRVYVEGVRSVM